MKRYQRRAINTRSASAVLGLGDRRCAVFQYPIHSPTSLYFGWMLGCHVIIDKLEEHYRRRILEYCEVERGAC
jgi:hypothetical protein